MAADLELKDESTANPCCSEWKDRLLKVQQKCKKTEDARAALKKAVGLYERQFTLMQDDIQKLKKACEEEKLHTDNERKDKEKESTARASLEKEISALKSELLSLSQKESSVPDHVNEELIFLRGRVSDSEKEIICLQEQLQKEKHVVSTNRIKALEDKKIADEALESSKAEKSRIEKELSNLKAHLLNLESEKKKLKKDLKKERDRADMEKFRADEALKTAKTETEAEMAEKNDLSSPKSELLSLSQKESSVPDHVNEELILLRGRVSDSEKEINCLQEQLQKDKKRAEEALESFKAEKNRIEKESSNLKAQLLNLESEKKQLKKDLSKERDRADMEKFRADEALKTAKTETEAEMAEKNDLSSPKSEDKDVITSLQGRVFEMETEINRLKTLLDDERKKAESEKKRANRMRELLKAQSKADEQTKIVDTEKKKGEEFAQKLERLQTEANELRSKLVLGDSKLKEANKKLESEKKKSIKEKKKYEEQQKIAELSTKNALEEKQRADMIHQQLEQCQDKYVKLQKEMEVKQKTKDTKHQQRTNNVSEKIEKDMNSKYYEIEMKLVKKRLKLEKDRVKHANQVAELEKKCKKAVEKELHQLKLEFARFSNRVGLCGCYETCHAGKSCLEKNGNVNLKRKSMHLESEKEHVKPPKSSQKLKPSLESPVQSLPVSGTCTESTSGTASKMDPLLGGSNRKNADNSALISSMSSFSDRQLVGCAFPNTKVNTNRHLQISRLSKNDGVVADNNVENTLGVKSKDGKTRKRRRTLNVTESIDIEGQKKDPGTKTVGDKNVGLNNLENNLEKNLESNLENGGKNVEIRKRRRTLNATESIDIEGQKKDPGTKTVADENVGPNNLENGGKNVEIFERMVDGDCMKLLNLDSELEEERYRVAVGRPLSPTLPNIEFESNQLDVLEDSRPSEVNCSNGLLPSVISIAVFPEIKDSGSLYKIFLTTKTFMSQCCVSLESDHVIKSIVSALSTEESLSSKEKICVFFSLFLKSPLSIALTKVNHVLDESFLKTIDIFSAQIKKVMSDVETRTIFEKVCNLDELVTLIQDFIINERLLIQTDTTSESLPLSDSKPSFDQLVMGAVFLASICVAFDRIDFICEASYTISHITSPSTSTILHIFAYICGERLLAKGDCSLIMTVVSSLVTYHEKESSSSCAKCPFLIGAVSMEELASLLLKRLSSFALCEKWKLKSVSDDALLDLGAVLSLLELIASKMKWSWVCENIVSRLLKLLEVFVVETPLTAAFVLLGQMARLGIDANGLEDADVENIRMKLSSFITGTSLRVQFAAINALLCTTTLGFEEICKNSIVSPSTAIDCIQKWYSLLNDEQKELSVRLSTVGVL